MKKLFPLFPLFMALLAPAVVFAKGGGGHGGGHHGGGGFHSVGRSHGSIHRSSLAKRHFQKTHPCPATGATSGGCKGYVIDHIRPLALGGPDTPDNMQWQTRAAAKAKDRVERRQGQTQ